MSHSHPYPDDLSAPPAYCPEHLPTDTATYQCESERHVCIVCEEAHAVSTDSLDAWFEHIATCKGC